MNDQQSTDLVEKTTRVEIVVSLDRVIGRTRPYDEDEVSEEITVLDAVIDRAAKDLLRDVSYDVKREITTAAGKAAKEQAAAAIIEVMAGPIQPTNHFGEPSGQPTSLRELVSAEVTAWLRKTPNRNSGAYERDQPPFVQWLREVVDKALREELKAPVAEAKKAAVDRVRDQAADLVAAAVQEAMKR